MLMPFCLAFLEQEGEMGVRLVQLVLDKWFVFQYDVW
jgi:hypothetical protein